MSHLPGIHPHLTSPIKGEGHDLKPFPLMGEGWVG
jgi:hypothetical protein